MEDCEECLCLTCSVDLVVEAPRYNLWVIVSYSAWNQLSGDLFSSPLENRLGDSQSQFLAMNFQESQSSRRHKHSMQKSLMECWTVVVHAEKVVASTWLPQPLWRCWTFYD